MAEENGGNTLDKLSGGSIRTEDGTIRIDEGVIMSVAASAASQVEGLGEKKSSVAEDIRRIFGSRRRGIQLTLKENTVDLAIKIAVREGYPVHEVAQKAQHTIIEEIESKTGLQINKVDIYVDKLQVPEESSGDNGSDYGG
ncbi:MAG: Asp23/Gls24 family envelope stress response protein [Candidatus Acetothermia bacterium]